MSDSSASAVVLLPFGSLMGVIPVDSVWPERVVGDFSKVLAGSGERMLEVQQQLHPVINPSPACTAGPPSLRPSGDGGS